MLDEEKCTYIQLNSIYIIAMLQFVSIVSATEEDILLWLCFHMWQTTVLYCDRANFRTWLSTLSKGRHAAWCLTIS